MAENHAHQRVPVAIFASGQGSNLQVFLDRERADIHWPVAVALVVSDKPNSMAVERARSVGVPTFSKSPKDYPDKAAYERDVLQVLHAHRIEWLVLAGYMRLVGSTLLEAYPSRILNIHPSLLPAFPGKDAIQQAIDAGVSQSGVTVHYVDAGMDTGPIIEQRVVQIDAGMTEAGLAARIHAVEHELYPAVVAHVITETQRS